MSSVKRKALESSLQRRVRARRDASEEPQELSESSDQDDGASGSEDGVDENLANNNESDDSVSQFTQILHEYILTFY
jgi:ribosomal RNA-processing protein 36